MQRLTDFLGREVRKADGGSAGRLGDLAVSLREPYPPVVRLIVRAGRQRLAVPWEAVSALDALTIL